MRKRPTAAILDALRVVEPFEGLDARDAAEVERVLEESHDLRFIERGELQRLNTVVDAARLHAELPAHRPSTLTFINLAIKDLEEYRRGRLEGGSEGGKAPPAPVWDAPVGPVDEDDLAPDTGAPGEGGQEEE